MTSVARITDALQTAGPHMGDLVFYRLWDATTQQARLERLAEEESFPRELLPSGMDSSAAWKRAMRTTHDDDHLIRFVFESRDVNVWAVVREDVVSDDLDYATTSRMSLMMSTGQRIYEHPEHEVCRAIEGKFLQLKGAVTTDQIRAMVKRICRNLDGVPIGTEWFVPGKHSELLRSMRGLVNRLGRSEVWLLPVHDTPDSRDTLNGAVRRNMESELESLKSEIELFDDSTRGDTLIRRLERFSEIRTRAALYKGMLEVAQTDLIEKVTGLEKTVTKLIGIKAEKEEAKQTKKAQQTK